ncbi:MAG: histidine--tRNA ligase [Bacteroidia bacterium]|nr:histidine--tRNA ligase [Bacteroidia bacterium]
MQKRNYIFETIRNVFLLHGFQQIETPAMENLSVLEGKYGEEGDRLLFRILNSGPVLEQIRNEKSEIKNSDVTEKGLRYDLTVPFARYVVHHCNEITFPFKRFQMQPVWRADRPQRGRYREFYQCDADIIGSDSLLNEVELIQIIDKVFTNLKIKATIKINNRKILQGIAEIVREPDRMIDIATAFDKLEKIGKDKVLDELREKGFPEDSLQRIVPYLSHGYEMERYRLVDTSVAMKKGTDELKFIMDILIDFKLKSQLVAKIEMDFSLARGLNYYTGTIIEVRADNVQIGSVCGGGRYDNLTGIFGLPDVSGVGISFGVDRIYDVMEELKLFDALKTEQTSTKILFVNFGEKEEIFCLKLVTELRNAGVAAELYPDRTKMKKQMSYADDRKIPFVAFTGEEEMKSGKIKLKNMKTGEEQLLNAAQIADFLKNN